MMTTAHTSAIPGTHARAKLGSRFGNFDAWQDSAPADSPYGAPLHRHPVPASIAADPSTETFFRVWLTAHRDELFRWTMARTADVEARRGLAEVAVAIQRLRGSAEFVAWLYGAALHAALREAAHGGLPEPLLTGLAPELRAVLRLVARADLRPEEASALLSQRMGYVRRRLVQVRLPG